MFVPEYGEAPSEELKELVRTLEWEGDDEGIFIHDHKTGEAIHALSGDMITVENEGTIRIYSKELVARLLQRSWRRNEKKISAKITSMRV